MMQGYKRFWGIDMLPKEEGGESAHPAFVELRIEILPPLHQASSSPSTHDFGSWNRRRGLRDLYPSSLALFFSRTCPETRRASQPDGKMVNITDKIKEYVVSLERHGGAPPTDMFEGLRMR